MQNGFDPGYLKEIAQKKIKERSSFVESLREKETVRNVDIYLIEKETEKLVAISDIALRIFEYILPNLKKYNITDINDPDLSYKDYIQDYLFYHFYASRSEYDPFREEDEIGLLASSCVNTRFTYGKEELIDYMATEFRSLFKTFCTVEKKKIDSFPRWYGERTREQIKETIKQYHPDEAKIPIGGNIYTLDIKTPITYIRFPVTKIDSNGDSYEVIQVHAKYHDEELGIVIRSPLSNGLRYQCFPDYTMTEEKKKRIEEIRNTESTRAINSSSGSSKGNSRNKVILPDFSAFAPK